MILASLAGALLGAAVLVLIRAVAGPRPALAAQLAAVENTSAVSRRTPVLPAGRREAVQRAVQDRLAAASLGPRLVDSGLRADLELLGIDQDGYVARKVVLAAATVAVAPPVLATLAALAGASWLVGAWLAVLAAGLVFVAPDQRVKRAATAHRRDFVATLTAYLDLVAMRTASGSGVTEALRDAALIGSGYGWRRLRLALDDARMEGKSPAAGLAALGAEIKLPELTELASQLLLVDVTGAQTEATLRAKAEALRERQLAHLHGDANARTQTMVVSQVMLGLGFLILIGYPAFAAVMAL